MIRLLAALVLATFVSSDTDPYRGFTVVGGKGDCCGGTDCGMLADDDVRVEPGGYYIISKGWFVPNKEAQLSFDQHYHVCEFPKGTRRCFFFPGRGV